MAEVLFSCLSCPPFTKLPDYVSSTIDSLYDSNTTQEPANEVCLSCTEKIRVESFEQIEIGDHICVAGEHSKVSVFHRQLAAYQHHAIVKSIKPLNESSASLTLIHFITTPFDDRLMVRETVEVKNVYYDEIYKIRYRLKTHPREDIVQRAENCLGKCWAYSVALFNCEHFCNWCCNGVQECFQISRFKGFVNNIVRFILVSLEDLASFLKLANTPLTLVIVIFVAIIDVLLSYWTLRKEMKNKILCQTCFKEKKWGLAVRFVLFIASQSLGVLFLGLLKPTVKRLVCMILFNACSFGFLYNFLPRLVKSFYFSPYRGKMTPADSLQDISVGDVVQFKDSGKSNDGIVSMVNESANSICVIFYEKTGLFSGCVVEKDVTFAGSISAVTIYDYSLYQTHPPEEVITRARLRIGETKYSMFDNRSSHFCHWAKVRQGIENTDVPQDEGTTTDVPQNENTFEYVRKLRPDDDLNAFENRMVFCDQRRRWLTTRLVGRDWAKVRNEVSVGKIIQFKYNFLWHKAVVVDVKFIDESPSKLAVTVVHYGEKQTVTEDTFVFDLRVKDIWIYKYHPLYTFNKDDVIRRARARIGEKGYHRLFNRSSHLASTIVKKPMSLQVESLDMVKAGDVISYSYWCLWHDGIVTSVVKDSPDKEDGKYKRGTMKVIHYALDGMFATRIIKEDTVSIDIRKRSIYRKNYDGYITYPQLIVVERARSRIGEQRFIAPIYEMANTSWDLVHWAKVVQSPSVMRSSGNSDSDRLYLILPRVGTQCDVFQKVYVYSWDDLELCSIIEFLCGTYAIVTSINAEENEIVVVYRRKGILTKVPVTIDLRNHHLISYRCHPNRRRNTTDILTALSQGLGYRVPNDFLNFCKSKVLIF